MKEKLPVLRERSERLDSALASNGELSTRIGAALLERDESNKRADEARVGPANALRAQHLRHRPFRTSAGSMTSTT